VLDAELTVARGGELVVAPAAVVLGDAPGRLEPSSSLHAQQRGVQRPLGDEEDVAGHRLDAVGDAPSMHGLEGERLQNQHLQGALEKLGAVGRHFGLLQMI